jgi:hypothetical protein
MVRSPSVPGRGIGGFHRVWRRNWQILFFIDTNPRARRQLIPLVCDTKYQLRFVPQV